MARVLEIAVFGATGAVGREIVDVLAGERLPDVSLHLVASAGSEGETVEFGEEERRVVGPAAALPGIDIAFLATPPDVSARLAKELVEDGAAVVDVTGAADPDAPLVLAEWNGPAVASEIALGGVASIPDPVTTIVGRPLRALHRVGALTRVAGTVLLPASSFGREAIARLGDDTAALLSGRPDDARPSLAFTSVAFGEVPGLGSARLDERLSRVLGSRELGVQIGVVRTPAFHGVGAAMRVESERPAEAERWKEVLRETPSVVVTEDPMETIDVVGRDAIAVHVADTVEARWKSLWIVADGIRQGPALNAVAFAALVARHRRAS